MTHVQIVFNEGDHKNCRATYTWKGFTALAKLIEAMNDNGCAITEIKIFTLGAVQS